MKKNILILVSILFTVIMSTGAFGQDCVDSDGGLVYDVFGTATSSTGSVVDSCVIHYENPPGSGMWTTQHVDSCDNSDPLVACKLGEGACNIVGGEYTDFYTCPEGCSDGVCTENDDAGDIISFSNWFPTVVFATLAPGETQTHLLGEAEPGTNVGPEVPMSVKFNFQPGTTFTEQVEFTISLNGIPLEIHTLTGSLGPGMGYIESGMTYERWIYFPNGVHEGDVFDIRMTNHDTVSSVHVEVNIQMDSEIKDMIAMHGPACTASSGHPCTWTTKIGGTGGELGNLYNALYFNANPLVAGTAQISCGSATSDLLPTAGAGFYKWILPIDETVAYGDTFTCSFNVIDSSGQVELNKGAMLQAPDTFRVRYTAGTPHEILPGTSVDFFTGDTVPFDYTNVLDKISSVDMVYSGECVAADPANPMSCGLTISVIDPFTGVPAISTNTHLFAGSGPVVDYAADPSWGDLAGSAGDHLQITVTNNGPDILFISGVGVDVQDDVQTIWPYTAPPVPDEPACGAVLPSGTYTLTSDLHCVGDGITFDGDDITLNGNGFTIYGDGTGTALNAFDVGTLTLNNIDIDGFVNGIKFVNDQVSSVVALSNVVMSNVAFNGIDVEKRNTANTLSVTASGITANNVGGDGLRVAFADSVAVSGLTCTAVGTCFNNDQSAVVTLGNTDVNGCTDTAIEVDYDSVTLNGASVSDCPVAIFALAPSAASTLTVNNLVTDAVEVGIVSIGGVLDVNGLTATGTPVLVDADGGSVSLDSVAGNGVINAADLLTMSAHGLTLSGSGVESSVSVVDTASVVLSDVEVDNALTALSLNNVGSAAVTGASSFTNIAGQAIDAVNVDVLDIGDLEGSAVAFSNSAVGSAVNAFDVSDLNINNVNINNFLGGINVVSDAVSGVVDLNTVAISNIASNGIDVEKRNTAHTLSVTASGITANNIDGDGLRVALADSVAVSGLTCTGTDTCFNNDQSAVVTLGSVIVNGCTDTALEVDYDSVTLNGASVSDCPVAIHALAPSAASVLNVNNLVTDNVDTGIVSINGALNVAGLTATGTPVLVSADGGSVSVSNFNGNGVFDSKNLASMNLQSGTLSGSGVETAVNVMNTGSVALSNVVVSNVLTAVGLDDVDNAVITGASSFTNIAGEAVDAVNVGTLDIGDLDGSAVTFSNPAVASVAVNAFDVGSLNVNNVNVNNFLNGINIVNDQVNGVVDLGSVNLINVELNGIDIEKRNTAHTLSVTANGISANNVGGDGLRVALADSVAVSGLTCTAVGTCFNNDQSAVVTLSGTTVDGCDSKAIDVDYDSVTLDGAEVSNCPVAIHALAPSAASTLNVNNLAIDNVEIGIVSVDGVLNVDGLTAAGTPVILDADGGAVSLANIAGSGIIDAEGLLSMSAQGLTLAGSGFETSVNIADTDSVALSNIMIDNVITALSLENVGSAAVTGVSSFTNIAGEAVSAVNVDVLNIGEITHVIDFTNVNMGSNAVTAFDAGAVNIKHVNINHFLNGINVINDQVNSVVTLEAVTVNNVALNGIDVEKRNTAHTLSVTASGITANNIDGDALRVALADSVTTSNLVCNAVDVCFNNDQSAIVTLGNTIVNGFTDKALEVDYDVVTINGANIMNGPTALFALAPDAASTLNVNNLVTQNVEVGIDADGGLINVNGGTVSAITTGINLASVAGSLITGATISDAQTGVYVAADSTNVRLESNNFVNNVVSINNQDAATGNENTCPAGSTILYADDGTTADCDNQPPAGDADGDGVPDDVDPCPADYGTFKNGCPGAIQVNANGKQYERVKGKITNALLDNIALKVHKSSDPCVQNVLATVPSKEIAKQLFDTCPTVGETGITTDVSGVGIVGVPVGAFVVSGHDGDDITIYYRTFGDTVVVENAQTKVGFHKFTIIGSYYAYAMEQITITGDTGETLIMESPDYVDWDFSQTDQMYYPFLFTSDSEWTIDVCAEVPEGYIIVAPDECVQTFVSGETKTVLFEVMEVGSPAPDMKTTIKVKSESGKVKSIKKDIGGKQKSPEKKAIEKKTKGNDKGKEGKAKGKALGNKITGSAVFDWNGGKPSAGLTVLIVIIVIGLYVFIHRQKYRK